MAGQAGTLKHFTNTQDLSDLEAQAILQLAGEMKAHWHAPLLKGKKLGMIFFNPSFRTRMSFRVAMFDLGGYVIARGTPEDLASNQDSFTGHYLGKVLEAGRKPAAEPEAVAVGD